MLDREELRRKQVVYTLPHMERARVQKNLPYKTVDDDTLHADIYTLPDRLPGARLPAVIFVSGDGPPEAMKGLKDSGQYTSWGQLIAASGLIAVTFDHRSPHPPGKPFTMLPEVASDVNNLLLYVRTHAPEFGIDAGRLAIWTCSGGPPFGLSDVLREPPGYLRCIVAYYGALNLTHLLNDTDPPELAALLHRYSPAACLKEHPEQLPPLLIVRAGLDHPRLNAAVDLFVAEAFRQNVTIDVMNHPQGQHAFDVLDDDERSREIIKRTLAFLTTYLLKEG